MQFEHLSRYDIIMTVGQVFWDMFLILLFSIAISYIFAVCYALVKRTTE